MKYRVRYEDNFGGEECVMEFDTIEEAEQSIEEDLERCKEYSGLSGYNYADFGRKTEFWVRGGNEYASWERLWPEVDWFSEIAVRLRDYSEGEIWSSGDEILCRTGRVADALADMFECLYREQGEDILINTGYYDPAEDERSGEVDRHTGWWYVNIG